MEHTNTNTPRGRVGWIEKVSPPELSQYNAHENLQKLNDFLDASYTQTCMLIDMPYSERPPDYEQILSDLEADRALMEEYRTVNAALLAQAPDVEFTAHYDPVGVTPTRFTNSLTPLPRARPSDRGRRLNRPGEDMDPRQTDSVLSIPWGPPSLYNPVYLIKASKGEWKILQTRLQIEVSNGARVVSHGGADILKRGAPTLDQAVQSVTMEELLQRMDLREGSPHNEEADDEKDESEEDEKEEDEREKNTISSALTYASFDEFIIIKVEESYNLQDLGDQVYQLSRTHSKRTCIVLMAPLSTLAWLIEYRNSAR